MESISSDYAVTTLTEAINLKTTSPIGGYFSCSSSASEFQEGIVDVTLTFKEVYSGIKFSIRDVLLKLSPQLETHLIYFSGNTAIVRVFLKKPLGSITPKRKPGERVITPLGPGIVGEGKEYYNRLNGGIYRYEVELDVNPLSVAPLFFLQTELFEHFA
jgi:hypothetical protein